MDHSVFGWDLDKFSSLRCTYELRYLVDFGKEHKSQRLAG